jgi:hypothetical protein
MVSKDLGFAECEGLGQWARNDHAESAVEQKVFAAVQDNTDSARKFSDNRKVNLSSESTVLLCDYGSDEFHSPAKTNFWSEVACKFLRKEVATGSWWQNVCDRQVSKIGRFN